MKSVTILGSTGSIGTSTLDLISRHPDRFSITALTAHRNVEMLAAQAITHRAKCAVIADEALYPDLVDALAGSGIETACGSQGVITAASMPSDTVMAAIVGAAGLAPTLAAIERGATISLANKEVLVCAGDLVRRTLDKSGARLIPVDSEHNAIWQVFDFDRPGTVSKIILTASGGPFRSASLEAMKAATLEEAAAHPTWQMGLKISIDSATMMNKGLEMIEAYHLFPVEPDKIDVVIHPQSVVHSMVEYCDGSILAQLGSPDMRTPIAYALAWPGRIESPSARLDFATLGSLTFEAPDPVRFPSINLAVSALKAGSAATCVLNAANEVSVDAFVKGQIGFMDIVAINADICDRMAGRISGRDVMSLQSIQELDREVRQAASELCATYEGALV